MQPRAYKTRRAYLVPRIRVLRHEVECARHKAFRESSRRILLRLLGELDDIDAAAATKVGV